MRPSAGSIATVAVPLLLFLVSRTAFAEPPAARRFRLSYEAPADCPSRDAFTRSITRRTSRARLIDEDIETIPSSIHIRVVIDQEQHGGHFTFREPDGTEEAKTIPGTASCTEVAHALSLSIALLLDPDAATTDAKDESSSVAFSSTPVTPKAPPESPKPRPLQPTASPWHRSAGVELGFIGGVGPAIAPMVALLFDLEHTRLFDRSGHFASSVRIAFNVAETKSDLRGGSHTYEWFGGTLRVCPLSTRLVTDLRIGPCAGFQVAAHRGTTRNVQNPDSATELWLAPLLLGTIQWSPARRYIVELAGGLEFPLRRTRFFLAPDTTIYKVPAIAGTSSLTAAYQF